KDAKFDFSNECVKAFETLKNELTKAPIMVKPDWVLPFGLMCDASDYAVGAVLGQRNKKYFLPIYYASKIMTDAQEIYTRIEKELLAVEFNIEVRDKKGAENIAANHLSRLENHETEELNDAEIDDRFPDESIMKMDFDLKEPWLLILQTISW
ncbi:reverse transcriptase domain-containing protein, partial [Tanacetum coccineum]